MAQPCKLCPICIQNCDRCPTELASCEWAETRMLTRTRINKQVSMSSSLAIYKKKAAMVSRQVGQSACPTWLSQAGGPGDLQTAIQQTAVNPYKKPCKRNCFYRLPILRTRTAYKGNSGVDRKHGSYARYLARRVGGELRKEQMPIVRERTAIIKQPRNRTGTSACSNMCRIPPIAPPAPLFSVRTRNKCLEAQGHNFTTKCCDNRIPHCPDKQLFTAMYVKSGFGGPGQGVASSGCTCCITSKRKIKAASPRTNMLVQKLDIEGETGDDYYGFCLNSSNLGCSDAGWFSGKIEGYEVEHVVCWRDLTDGDDDSDPHVLIGLSPLSKDNIVLPIPLNFESLHITDTSGKSVEITQFKYASSRAEKTQWQTRVNEDVFNFFQTHVNQEIWVNWVTSALPGLSMIVQHAGPEIVENAQTFGFHAGRLGFTLGSFTGQIVNSEVQTLLAYKGSATATKWQCILDLTGENEANWSYQHQLRFIDSDGVEYYDEFQQWQSSYHTEDEYEDVIDQPFTRWIGNMSDKVFTFFQTHVNQEIWVNWISDI